MPNKLTEEGLKLAQSYGLGMFMAVAVLVYDAPAASTAASGRKGMVLQ